MKRYFLFLIFFFPILVLQAQNPPFEIIYGGSGYDNARSVIQTNDSGYAITGSSTSWGDGSTDIFLLKLDKSGSLQWIKDYGGANIDRATSIRQTNDYGFIIAGFTNSFGLGGYGAYLIRTDSSGDTLWTKTFGGLDWSFGSYAEQTSNDSGYIIAGSTYNTNNTNEDAWLIKTDSMGNIIWSKNYGGVNDESGRIARRCSNGDYILIGTTNSFGAGNEDVYLVRTDLNGDTLWTRTYGGALDDEGRFVEETSDGGLIFCNSYTQADSIKDFNLIKTDAGGNVQWNNYYFGNVANDEPYEVHQIADGTYRCLGYSRSYGDGGKDFMLLKTDGSGNWKYGYTFGGVQDDIGYSLATTFNQGFVLAGETESYGALPVNIYVIVTDSAGIATGNILYGIKENSVNTISSVLFPNPADKECYFSFKLKNPGEKMIGYHISTLEGRTVAENYSLGSSERMIKIPVQSLAQGLYILSINTSSGVISKKLNIIHR